MASILVDLVVGAFVFVSLLAAAVATTAFVAWRYGRRKWRALRAHGAVVGAGALWAAISSRHVGSRPADSEADLTGRPSRLVRKELWRSVDRADGAVRTADDLGSSTASLPSLCRQLRQTAIALDRILRVDPSRPVSPALADQVFGVMRAASDIQGAALSSAGEATGPRVDELTRDAGNELACLDAGLASARTALGAPNS